MKIVHCVNYFLPGNIAGTEVYIFSLCKALLKLGVEAVVVIPNYGCYNDEVYFYEEVRVVKYAQFASSNRALQMGEMNKSGVNSFLAILKSEKPDIVHFHELTAGTGITLHHLIAAKKNKFKVFMTFHVAGYTCSTGTLMYKNEQLCDGYIDIKRCTNCVYSVKDLSWLNRKTLLHIGLLGYKLNLNALHLNNAVGTAIGYPFIIKKKKDDLHILESYCDQLIVLSEWYKQVLLLNDVNEKKIKVVKQGLPGKIIDTNNNEEHETLRIVFVGRINRGKGLHILINALKKIETHKVVLDIYGQIDDEEYAVKCKKQAGDLSNVHWKGAILLNKVIQTLAVYDVLCLPSTFSEMSPLVIQEAFAAGIPVIASDCYGNVEQITDNLNGWLFHFNDSDDLKKKIDQVLIDRDLIRKAKLQIPALRSFQKVAEEYMSIYSSNEKEGQV